MLFTGLFGLASTVGFSAAVAATGVTCVTIGQTGGNFLLGAIGDKFGTRTALLTGIGSGILGVVALMISDNFGLWMIFKFQKEI